MITIMGGLAQEESVSISQNMKWSIRNRMKNGTYRNSHSPFGYDIQNGNFVINEMQANIVRNIFSLYLSGVGLQSIANELNAASVRSSQYGEKWCPMAIRYILTNERYTGNAIFQKSFRSNTVPFVKKRNDGELPKYYLTAANPPIITEEIFELTQKMLLSRSHKYLNYNNIFSGIIFCKKCGATYKGKYGAETLRWVCRTHEKSISVCDNIIIDNDDVEISFIRLFNKLLKNYYNIIIPIQKSLQELEIKQAVGNTNVIEIRRNILQLKEQLRIIAELRTKGFLSEAKCNEQTAEINVKINKLTKDLRMLSQSSDDTLKDIEMLIDYFEKRDHIMVDFEAEAFEFLVDKIIVNGNTLEFHIMGGLKFTEKI